MTPEQLTSVQAWIHYVPIVVTVLVFIAIVIAVARLMRNEDTDIQWADLISVLAHNGVQRADWNQIGKGGGVILCIALPFIYVYSPSMEAIGLAAVMGVALAYLGGVSAYAANLRSKQGSVETTKTTEADAVLRTTETTVQTPPVEPVVVVTK